MIAARDEYVDLAEIDRRVAGSVTAFASKGMVQTYSAGHGSSVLYLFRNESHDPAGAMSTDNAGRFCTYVGTMIYKGRTGSQATTAILKDVAAGRSGIPDSAFGNYSLLIGDKRGLRVLTDPAGLHHVYHSDDLTLVTNSFVAAGCTARSQELGRQEILEVVDNELVRTALDFGDMGTAEAWWRLIPDGEGTRVIWGLNTDMGAGPVGRWVGLMMDGMIGPDYETGLARLQAAVEG